MDDYQVLQQYRNMQVQLSEITSTFPRIERYAQSVKSALQQYLDDASKQSVKLLEQQKDVQSAIKSMNSLLSELNHASTSLEGMQQRMTIIERTIGKSKAQQDLQQQGIFSADSQPSVMKRIDDLVDQIQQQSEKTERSISQIDTHLQRIRREIYDIGSIVVNPNKARAVVSEIKKAQLYPLWERLAQLEEAMQEKKVPVTNSVNSDGLSESQKDRLSALEEKLNVLWNELHG